FELRILLTRTYYFNPYCNHTMRFLFASVLLVLFSSPIFAQRTHMLSFGMGTTYYNGDLTDQLNNMLFRPAAHIGYTKYFTPHFSYRVGMSYGQIGASDTEALERTRRIRNLHFKSNLYEVHGVLIYEFRRDKNFGNDWMSRPFLSPYVFGGIGFFYFNPKARYDGVWYELQPLGTEGQNIPGNGSPGPYSRLQASVPFGAGLNIRISAYAGVSFELGWRATMTDYLDDVSTNYPDFEQLQQVGGPIAVALSDRSKNGFAPGDIRGNPGVNDYYLFGSFCITYYLSRYASRGD
ncbi:MAG: DUF6089 family protein, partial [Bacteroidota bacterium]